MAWQPMDGAVDHRYDSPHPAGDRDRCLAAGMEDYISKPLRIEQLVEALSKCLPFSEETDTDGMFDQPGAPATDTEVLAQQIKLP